MISSLTLPNNAHVIQSVGAQPGPQLERMAVDQQNRNLQQGPVWRPATVQTVRPQYALIQRDGSIVQTQPGNWQQYQLQQQRLQQQGPG